MIIKAISVWQPSASLIAMDLKHFETRSWKTDYRGPLLICASLHKMSEEEKSAISENMPDEIKGYFRSDFERFLEAHHRSDSTMCAEYELPFGKAVCLVDLVDCMPANLIYEARFGKVEVALGDFGFGRWAWELKNPRTFEPFPVRGKQGIFDVEVPDNFLEAA